MNIFNTPISLFKPTLHTIEGKVKGTPGTDPIPVTFDFAIHWNPHPELLEAIKSETDVNVKKSLKSQLHAITPSAFMEGGRKSTCIKNHSGLMQFDIDHIDGNITDYFNAIKEIPYVAYLSTSASGNGLWGVFPIAYPEKH